jgi:two-component system OmpR family sensor kinase
MPIRLRLALWCALILAVGLIGFSTLIYAIADHTLHDAADQVIAGRAQRLDTLLNTAVQGGVATEHAEMARAVQVFSSLGVAVELLDSHGNVLARTPGVVMPVPPDPSALGPHAFYAGRVAGDPFRIYLLRRDSPGVVRSILVGHNVKDIAQSLSNLLLLLVSGSALCLALVGAAAWLLARQALTPISTLTGTAAAIARSGDLMTRVRASARHDEVGQMASTFNAMLDRLAELHTAQRRFIADASHELRAPLTTIRGNAELLLLDVDASAADREDSLRDIVAESTRLSRLVEELLALARGDAGQVSRPQPVQFHELLVSVAQAMATRPAAPSVTVDHCDPVVVQGDPDRLEGLLINLLDNALKYTSPDGIVHCALRSEEGRAVLTVRDSGVGIEPDDLPHIFDRFYRADRARRRVAEADPHWDGNLDVPGTGLGLAIARQIVEEAGGTITAASTPGMGSVFTVRLPATQPSRTIRAASR